MIARLARCAALLGGAAFFSLAPRQALAQERAVLRGRVYDAESSTLVQGAFVAEGDARTGVLTDSLGAFALPVGASATYLLRVTQLGYHSAELEIGVQASGEPILVRLAPDPVQIQGLVVVSERLAARRRGPFGNGEILDREALLKSPDGSAFDLILRRMPLRKAERICLDDHAVSDEIMLSGLDPRALYLVEVYRRVGEIRMYTPAYMKRLVESGQVMRPLTFGCGDTIGPGGGAPDGTGLSARR